MSRDVLGAIRRGIQTQGYPPTFRELAAKFDVAVGTIHADIEKLEADGLIEKYDGTCGCCGQKRKRMIRLRERT